MKVNISKNCTEAIDIQLPIFVYYQDENCCDEYIKIDETDETSVKATLFGYEISTHIHRGDIRFNGRYLDNLTTKELYDEHLKYAKEYINSLN